MTSAGVAVARSAGDGQRAIQSRQTGSTRATGVCCSMTSLTSTAQASTSGRRHGRSRAAVAYQSTRTSPTAGADPESVAVPTLVTGAQSAVLMTRRATTPPPFAEHYRSRRVAPGRTAARGGLLAPPPGGPGPRAAGGRGPGGARRVAAEWPYRKRLGGGGGHDVVPARGHPRPGTRRPVL